MILYHGTNIDFNVIDLTRSNKYKDFGQGFYLTDIRSQAEELAVKKTKLFGGNIIVQEYDFDESVLNNNDLRIIKFDSPTVEWAEFILMNRKNVSEIPAHPYDIVVGPIANDTVGVQIRRFIMGYISIERLIEELKYRGNHSVQYFFGTEAAIHLLNKVEL